MPKLVVERETLETRPKQAEKAPKSSEKKYRDLLDNALVGVYKSNLKGDLLYVNEALLEMFEFESPEEMEREGALRRYKNPKDRETLVENLKKTGKINDFELEVRTKTGKIKNVLTSATLDGDVLSGTVLDITERKEMEENIKQAASEWGVTFDAITDLVSVHNKNFKLVRVNKAFADAFGIKPEELIGKTCYEVIHKTKQHWPNCPHKQVLETKKPVTVDFFEPRLGKYIEISASPIFDEKGEVTSSVHIIKDITERKEMEGALKESEEKFRTIFENANDAILYLDRHGKILDVNKKVEDIFGYKQNEVIGQNAFTLGKTFNLKNMPRAVKLFKDIIRGGNSANLMEFELNDKNGNKVFAEVSARTIEKNGKIDSVLAILRDVTPRKRAEEELGVLNKELLKTNKKLKQLTLKDPHTGLYNYRYLKEVMEAEFHRARRHAHQLSVIMMDIDYFKAINDTYGHQFGDLVLRQLAKQLKRIVRRYDIVIRFGGEEFIIISPGTGGAEALILAQRLLGAINSYNFGDKKHIVKLKISAAVASYPMDEITESSDLTTLADQILRKVKEDGGNRVYSSIGIKEKKLLGSGKTKQSGDVRLLKERVKKLTKRADQSLSEAIFAFAKTIKLKDHYTGEHVERAVQYATETARFLGLPEDKVIYVGHAAILHDLGKIGISEKILLKGSKLTKGEFDEIKKHPQIGADIIKPIKIFHDIIPLILYHHERWDGKGYPNGLRGEEIPVGARIVAVADVYQALISDRPYRKAYPKDEAMKIIKNHSGTQFDPKVVKVFLEVLRQEK